MITLFERQRCTGCGVCAAVCPVGAIRMEEQNGFFFPVVSNDCMDCGRCMKKCSLRFSCKNNTPFTAWQLNSRNKELRFKSTSGAFVGEAARSVLSDGGCVFGAAYANDFLSVKHRKAESLDELEVLLQSKYVQSVMGDVYDAVRTELDKDRMVLFCGTPCQVAALKTFIGNNDNLITIDFICRGINSPFVYMAWLKELESTHISNIQSVWFKYKAYGWKKSPLCTKVCFQNGTETIFEGESNLYMRAFLEKNLFIRESCSHCDFKGRARASDITVGDFWGAADLHDDGGTSLVIANNAKGKVLIEKILPCCEWEKVDFETAVRGNPAYYSSVERSPYADRFISELLGKSFRQAVIPYLDSGAKYLIFGAGALGEIAFEYYTRIRKVDVVGFLDNSQKKTGGCLHDRPIWLPDDVKAKDGCWQVIVALKYPDAAVEQLRNLGFESISIFKITEMNM